MKKIFVIHGWTYSTDRWQPFVKNMKEKGFETVLLNVPGLTEKTDKAWTLDDYTEWLRETLDKEKGDILIGHSNGGRIALAFAAKYPAKLRSLILIDSAGIYHNELPIRLKRVVFKTLAKVGKIFTTSKILRNFLYRIARESDYKDATPQMRQTMINLISTDLTPRLNKIKTKTLIIWGKEDGSTPLGDGEVMSRMIPNCELYVIDNARHSPHFTNTGEVCKIIYEHL